jgi:hypothetical protein
MPEGRAAGGAKRRALTAPSTAISCKIVMAVDKNLLLPTTPENNRP